MTPKPTSFNASRAEKQVTVTWDDSHVSLYPFSLLRVACPCAECRGGHDKMGQFPDPAVFLTQPPAGPATSLINILPIGSYAIAILWEDGHDAGIFQWGYLRALCPCPACQASSHPPSALTGE